MTVELLHDCDYLAKWLAKKSRAIFSTNEKQNPNQSHLVRKIFPVLWANHGKFA